MLRVLAICIFALAGCRDWPTEHSSENHKGDVVFHSTLIGTTGTTYDVYRFHDKEAGIVCYFIPGGGNFSCIGLGRHGLR